MIPTDRTRLQTLMQTPQCVALWQALLPLRSCISLMNTGAHPDDETTPMLVALAWRDGVRISQACANRGEGGQNSIGNEAGADLGTVRSAEMAGAAAVIPLTQYWLSQSPKDSIFDFGFSKSGQETLEKWGKMRVLARFVEIIRRERPDIICPTFLDVSGQHGHHRAMTRCAFKAVELAADMAAFPGQNLPPWRVKKLYLPAWSGAGDAYDDALPPPKPTTLVDASGGDPVLGADYTQIAQYSRSFHQTQGMGQWVEAGQKSLWPLHLAWESRGATGDETSIFANLPKTLRNLAEFANAPSLLIPLSAAQDALDRAINAWPDHQEVQRYAIKAHAHIEQAEKECPPSAQDEVMHRLAHKKRALARVLLLARGGQPRVSLSKTSVRPGESLRMALHGVPEDTTAKPALPEGWRALVVGGYEWEITTPVTALPSDPYPDIWFPDRANAPLNMGLKWVEKNQEVKLGIDPEVPLTMQPDCSASLSQHSAIINRQSPSAIRVEVSDIFPSAASPALTTGPGWEVKQSGNTFIIEASEDPKPGGYIMPLTLNGHPAQALHKTDYPHIAPTLRCTSAALEVQVMDVALPRGRIAYIGGGGDRSDHCLRQAGFQISSLTAEEVRDADFSAYDSILIGIFAFRTCAPLVERLADLHQWVRAGGNLVTLYHRPWDGWDAERTALAPLAIGKPSLRWRVTDESAEVQHLHPAHRLLNTPNQITQADWQGWHKERGLYFAASWDEAYEALLSMADQDEAPLTGALLSGRFGKGWHSHTSLILHHQVQKLVPGAFRLFANLLDNPG